VPTIRYYEHIGLLPTPRRSAGNQRLYGPDHVERLAFIRHSRELGFSQASVRELLELAGDPGQSCTAVTEVARTHLDDVNRRIGKLVKLKAELERMIDQCHGDRVSDCQIIETLADHSHGHCLDDNH